MFTTMYIGLIICIFKMAFSDVIVETSSGPVQGVTALSGNVEAFLGIPYAEPPVGDLRFAKPVPKESWTESLDASKMPPPCAQFSLDNPNYSLPDLANMSEDCLYLNLWTPKSVSNSTVKPVVIFFHHGGFILGSASMSMFDGAHFSGRGNVVVVTFNFRLGSFGFLLTDIEEASGNMGMYDQVMAIKWVKENAQAFGGDPGNIVLMGVSAGGISVGMHMVSPLSKNLFQKVIIHSGGMTMPYFYDNTRLLKASEELASLLGCTNETVTLKSDPYSVVECLKRQPVDPIVKAQRTLVNRNPLLFFPRVNDEFLPQSTVQLLREGKFNKSIPVLTGINRDEGSLFIIAATPEYFGVYGKNSSQAIGKNLAVGISRGLMTTANESNASEVLEFYVSHVKNRSPEGYSKMIADIVGDYSVACGTVFQADFFSLKGNALYFYKFLFRSPSTPMAEWVGTTHLDDLQYIFGNPFHKNFTDEEIELSHRMMDRWSAFARTGSPNIPGQIPWLRYSYHNQFYLSIEQNEESIRMKPLERCKIWRKRFKSDIDTDLVRFLRNSGLNIMNKNPAH